VVGSKEDPMLMSVEEADISDLNDKHPLRLIKRRTGPDGRRIDNDCCLVHVATCSMREWGMWYESTAWDEELIQDRYGERVDRIFKPFPSCGVDVIATGLGESGEPQALLRMKKRSSFRICRNIDHKQVDDFTSPVLVVVWPGSSLRCFPPKKHLLDSERRRAA
jgi:hypothetical protein